MKKITSLFMVLVLVLAGCSNGASMAFVTPINEIEGFDTRKIQYSQSAEVATDTQATLAKRDATGKVINGTAQEIKESDDKKKYTITLKDGLVWVDSNGEEKGALTAADYVNSWMWQLDPANAGDAAYKIMLYPIKNAKEYTEKKAKAEDVGIKLVDEKTIEIEFKEALPYAKELLAYNSLAPIPTDFAKEMGKDYGTTADKTLFSGAYYLTADSDKASDIIAKKNEKYYDAANVKVTEVTYKTMKDANTVFQAFESNEIQTTGLDYFAFPTKADYDAAKEKEGYNTAAKATVFYTSINTEGKFTKNVNLRKALQYSFETQKAVDTLYGDAKKGVGHLIPTDLTKSSFPEDYREVEQGELIKYDSAKAKEYLNKAMQELGVKNAKDIKLTYLTNDTPRAQKIAEYLQATYKKELGITFDIEILPTPQYIEKRRKGGFDLAGGGWSADYGDPSTYIEMFTSNNIDDLNAPRYSNAEYDKAVEEAAKITDPAKYKERFDAYYELEKKLVVEDAILVPFYQNYASGLTDPKFDLPDVSYGHISKEFITVK
ncbi:MAG: peptide ABC transporter substrate-binding protein [Mycoplasmatales bacterium]